MRLATLAAYRDLVYAPGSAPSMDTLRKRIKEIPGGRIELGRYYVDLDLNDKVNQLAETAHTKLEAARKNPNLNGLL